MLKSAPHYTAIVNKVMRQDIYLEAMKEIGVITKFKDMQKQTLFDGVFDAADPEKYAMSFSVRAF
jgi:uncharacterized membrane protein YvbJ